MNVVVRTYSGKGAKELFDVLEKRKADVESIMRSVNDFVSYTLARSGDGGFSVTVCKSRAGIDESVQKAKEWEKCWQYRGWRAESVRWRRHCSHQIVFDA